MNTINIAAVCPRQGSHKIVLFFPSTPVLGLGHKIAIIHDRGLQGHPLHEVLEDGVIAADGNGGAQMGVYKDGNGRADLRGHLCDAPCETQHGEQKRGIKTEALFEKTIDEHHGLHQRRGLTSAGEESVNKVCSIRGAIANDRAMAPEEGRQLSRENIHPKK